MSVRWFSALLFVHAIAGAAAADPVKPGRAPAAAAERARVPLDAKRVAQAPAVKVTCDILEISASTGSTPSTDPKLKAMEKKLSKQVWKFNQYKLLSQGQKVLEKGKVESLQLKSGSGTATLVETVDKSKVRINVTEDHDGKRVVNNTTTIAAGDWLIVGHPVSANKDGHLVAVSCK